MWDLKGLKAKIWSTKNIRKITGALEIIATLKLQKTKKKTEALRNYVDHLLQTLMVIQEQINLYSENKHHEKEDIPSHLPELHIVIGSEKWLCGSLNAILNKEVHQLLAPHKKTIHLFTIGNKAHQFFSKQWYNIVWTLQLVDDINHSHIESVSNVIDTHYEEDKYAKIVVHYNYFKNTMKYIPTHMQLYPLHKSIEAQKVSSSKWLLDMMWGPKKQMNEYIMEPNTHALKIAAQEAISRYIVYSWVLQNKTSEFASRMIAMKWAKDNANAIVDDLTIAYNKARQDSITQEVLEIVWAKSVIEAM